MCFLLWKVSFLIRAIIFHKNRCYFTQELKLLFYHVLLQTFIIYGVLDKFFFIII